MTLRRISVALLLPALFSCDSKNSPAPTEAASFDESRSGNRGSGSRFEAIGNARTVHDPENRTNVVVRAEFDGTTPTGVKRDLKRVQIHELDHQLSYKWAFVQPNTCAGGSPRFILLIDANGDGRFQTAPSGPDFAANGQINPPLFAACINGLVTPSNGDPAVSTLPWRFEDATDEQRRWDITGGIVPGFPVYPGATWDELEALISTLFPSNRVLQVRLLEDSDVTLGTTYYDLITVFDLTLGTQGQEHLDRRGGNDDNDDDEGDDD